MLFYQILVILLVIVIIIIAMTSFLIIKKSVYFTNKDKKYIIFVIDIFSDYGDEIGVQSKDEHKKLVDELNKIKNKLLK